MAQSPPDLLAMCNGNASAAAFLRTLGQISQIADDIADGESADPQRHMAEVLRLCMIELPANPFYMQHAATLQPLLLTTIMSWDVSNRLARSERLVDQQFAFVLRELDEQLLHVVAYLCGGYDAAMTAFIDYHEHQHTETFEEWRATL